MTDKFAFAVASGADARCSAGNPDRASEGEGAWHPLAEQRLAAFICDVPTGTMPGCGESRARNGQHTEHGVSALQGIGDAERSGSVVERLPEAGGKRGAIGDTIPLRSADLMP